MSQKMSSATHCNHVNFVCLAQSTHLHQRSYLGSRDSLVQVTEEVYDGSLQTSGKLTLDISSKTQQGFLVQFGANVWQMSQQRCIVGHSHLSSQQKSSLGYSSGFVHGSVAVFFRAE